MRDLARYRMKTVQARSSEIQRLQKTLESAGIKLDSVVSDITGMSSTAMTGALIDGERRGEVLADLAQGRLRTAGKMSDLSMALAGRFTGGWARSAPPRTSTSPPPSGSPPGRPYARATT